MAKPPVAFWASQEMVGETWWNQNWDTYQPLKMGEALWFNLIVSPRIWRIGGWNMAFIFPNGWDDDPIWRTHIFQRGSYTTNQCVMSEDVVCSPKRKGGWLSGNPAHCAVPQGIRTTRVYDAQSSTSSSRTGWWFGTFFCFSIIYMGMSSSQLTNSYFSEGLVETTNQISFVRWADESFVALTIRDDQVLCLTRGSHEI